MCILDACVGTEAACRREPVCGITSQENPAVPEAFSDLGCSGPEGNVNQFDGKGRDADGMSCKRQAPLGCEVFWFLPVCQLEGSQDQPAVRSVRPQQRAIATRRYITDGWSVTNPLCQFGAEVNINVMVQLAGAEQLDR